MEYVDSRWRFRFSGNEFFARSGVRYGDVLGISASGKLFLGAETTVPLPTTHPDAALYKGEELDWGVTALRLWLEFIDSATAKYALSREQEASRATVCEMKQLAMKLDQQLQELARPEMANSRPPDLTLSPLPPGMLPSDILQDQPK